MGGFLETAPDWFLGIVTSLVFLLFLVAYWISLPSARRRSYDFMRENLQPILNDLPEPVDNATLLGLVLAAIAVVTSYAPKNELYRYNAILMFLSGAGFFLFLQMVFTHLVTPLGVYFSISFATSVWFCLSLSLFALIDTLLPDRIWRFVLLLPPIGLLYYSGKTIELISAPQ